MLARYNKIRLIAIRLSKELNHASESEKKPSMGRD